MTLGEERQFVELQADAVSDETGLESWGPQVTVLVTQLVCELKSLYAEESLQRCLRSLLLDGFLPGQHHGSLDRLCRHP